MTDTQPAPTKARAADLLPDVARGLHRAIVTGYARTGTPPTRARLGASSDAVLAELVAADLIVLDGAGQIAAAYPFSTTPTRHRLALAHGVEAYAMCAIDALGVSAMLGQPVTITSTEPDTGATITVHVNGDTATWKPRGAVAYAAHTGESCAPAAERSCHHINLFTARAAAHTWAAGHPELSGRLLRQRGALDCGIAEFGTLLAT